MDGFWTIVATLVTPASLGIAFAAIKKAWAAREDAGYQRRKKEEQAEESLETIEELESEVDSLTSDLSEETKRRITAETFLQQQQDIIADQAKALANLDPTKAVR